MADAFTSETYNALCRDAEGYLARGLAEQARELLLKATSLIGTRARARSLLADACMQLTLWGEAKSQLEALATLEVDNIHTHFRLGQVLEETGEYQLAMDNFRVVLDMNPDHHGAKVSISRLEMVSKEQPPSKIPSVVEGQQIYADSGDGGVFSEDSGSIDELLNTIGMGEKKEVDGVEDLLNSIGMNNEEKKKAKVDFDSIFGTPPQGEGTADDTPLSDVFSQDQPDQPASSESSSLDSIFGGDAPPASDTETEPPAADLGAMFGGGESVAESTEADADIPEAVPETNLDSIFGGDESPVAETDSEPPAVEEPPAADLGAMFGGGESVAESTEADADIPEAVPETNLDSIFGGDESPETEADSEPPAVEEPPAEATETDSESPV
ncbi:MAG: hypothetical protein KAH54_05375, partial [Candidatus Sabulitectum sp.]|nr:hypothetical protein [Candidatus Sabulitectum sp.]